MLTQSRNLNTISNNMVNIQTPGYKNETMVSSTFKEEMLYRTGQYSKENPTQLATVSKIKTAKQVYTNYDQGGLEQTDGIYDFALNECLTFGPDGKLIEGFMVNEDYLDPILKYAKLRDIHIETVG